MKKILLLGCLTLPICVEQVCAGQEPKGRKNSLDLCETAGADLTNALFALQHVGENEKAEKLADEFTKDRKTLIPESVAKKNPVLLQRNKEKNEKLVTKLRNEIFETGIQIFETLLQNPQEQENQLNELKTMLLRLPALTTAEKKRLDEVILKFETIQKKSPKLDWKLYSIAGIRLTDALAALGHIDAKRAESLTQQFSQDHDTAKLRKNIIDECKALLKETLGQSTKLRIIRILEELPKVTKDEATEFEGLRNQIVKIDPTDTFE